MKELTEKEALNKAAAYCSSAEHCRSEVESKLSAWGITNASKDKIIGQLAAEGYIDEQRYCRSFINDKLRFNKWGKQKIAQMLRSKGIQSSLFERLLKEVDESEYIRTLQKLISDKRKSVKAKNEYELNGKLIRFGISRGFEISDIQDCIKSVDNVEVD